MVRFPNPGEAMPGLLPEPQQRRPLISDPQTTPQAKLILEGYLRTEELAAQLGLSRRTLGRWQANRKGGPPRIRVGRTVLYSVESVRQWLASQEQQTRPVNNRRNHLGVK